MEAKAVRDCPLSTCRYSDRICSTVSASTGLYSAVEEETNKQVVTKNAAEAIEREGVEAP